MKCHIRYFEGEGSLGAAQLQNLKKKERKNERMKRAC